MSIFAAFSCPTETFPPGKALSAAGDAQLELERIIPADESILPFFWLIGTEDEIKSFAIAARDEPDIERLTRVDTIDNRTLFRTEWTPDVDGIVRGIAVADATILKAAGNSSGWHFEMRFSKEADVREFQQYCHEHDIPIELDWIRRLVDSEEPEKYGLTQLQHETLLMAYERGYFREPRETSLDDLAAEFGITERAVSRRIDRGIERLLGATIADDER